MQEYTEEIEELKVGQLVVIKLPPMMDENFSEKRETQEEKDKLNDDVENAPRYPAVILQRKEVSENYGGVVFKVGFFSRHRSGQMSGMLELDNIPIWRYFSTKEGEPETGIPPKWLLDTIQHNQNENIDMFDDLSNHELFYIIKENDKLYKKYVIQRNYLNSNINLKN
jgi:hypothetical protein